MPHLSPLHWVLSPLFYFFMLVVLGVNFWWFMDLAVYGSSRLSTGKVLVWLWY